MKIPITKIIGILTKKSDADRFTRNRKTTTDKQETGDYAENIAFDFLGERELTILHRNFLCKVGEIDLIALDRRKKDPCVVFVEVRYRRNQNFGGGLESITWTKQEKLRRAASVFLLQEGSPDISCRFDVICITGSAKQIKIQWIENAF